MKKLLIIGSLILTVAVAKARDGYYIGAEAGAGFLSRTPKKSNLKEAFGVKKVKRNSGCFLTGLQGGYNFDIDEQMSVAPQLGFRYIQKAKISVSDATNGTLIGEIFSGSHQLNVLDFLAVGTYKVNSLWDFQAKIGAALITDKIRVSSAQYIARNGEKIPADRKSKTKKSVRPEAGIGIGYLLNQDIRISLNASHIFGSKSKLPKGKDSDTASLANAIAKKNQVFESIKKVPSLTSVSLSLQYMF
jgi:outer membrane autotransporter protein